MASEVVAGLLLLWSLIWHVRRMRFVPFGLRQIQANQRTAAHGVSGALYFGAVLGSGLMTKMATPLVQASAILAIAGGLRWALAYGAAFAAARSTPVWIGLIRDTSDQDPHKIAMGFIHRQVSLRWLGVIGALVGGTSLLVS